MTEKDKISLTLLNEELVYLDKSLYSLKLSLEKSQGIGTKKEYSFEEMETFDSFTSKFGRTSDLYTQKVLRTIWMLLHEAFLPFIDMLNKAEKLSIIHSADSLLEIRDLRNQITHEYIPEAITDLIPEVMEKCQDLFKNIETTKNFIQQRNWN
ncbi:hypothetical protein [Draconibacterium halophilum]|uniref:Toxin-antitoxin system antitoxin subunit n=1 Tax=Draconibacterium halophilum TaxID=2706887 RepID=A0A6C0RFB5_9BACT|nr:hypothetical protein [Draconibacterium halophilum]QIA08532.1 hypothetical protein G0Q07_12755 [Draconibacterium halophilum]